MCLLYLCNAYACTSACMYLHSHHVCVACVHIVHKSLTKHSEVFKPLLKVRERERARGGERERERVCVCLSVCCVCVCDGGSACG